LAYYRKKREASAAGEKSAKKIVSENEVINIKIDMVIEGPVMSLVFL
jgi:hypothetical protein